MPPSTRPPLASADTPGSASEYSKPLSSSGVGVPSAGSAGTSRGTSHDAGAMVKDVTVVAVGLAELAVGSPVGTAEPTATAASKPSMATPVIPVRELTVVLSIGLNVTNANSVDVPMNG
ncbi:Uncharacterised protein [Mycobacteroides abscessus]|nr:Uncharacterised protein [Mycobacteroides abscessus]